MKPNIILKSIKLCQTDAMICAEKEVIVFRMIDIKKVSHIHTDMSNIYMYT